jgi:hypothetical protein
MNFRFPVFAIAAVIFAGVLSPAGYAQDNEHGVAVIIGNKDYKHRDVPEVSFAHRDADAFKRYVTGVLGYRAGNIIDLRNATKAELESAFGIKGNPQGQIWQYLRKGQSDVVVFYSGHGVPGLQTRRGYLLPSDANPLGGGVSRCVFLRREPWRRPDQGGIARLFPAGTAERRGRKHGCADGGERPAGGELGRESEAGPVYRLSSGRAVWQGRFKEVRQWRR